MMRAGQRLRSGTRTVNASSSRALVSLAPVVPVPRSCASIQQPTVHLHAVQRRDNEEGAIA
jgi:hypothetical protein